MLVKPKLSALNGPLRNSEFLVGESLSIGRDAGNVVCLDDASVSVRHCLITMEKEGYCLADLESASGTFVNGLPAKRRILASGDQIVVGNTLFQFHDGARASAGSAVQLDNERTVGEDVEQVQQNDLLYLHPESLAALPQPARTARALGTLLKISTAIGSIRDVESLQWQLLGMIFDVVPGERGAILLVDDNGEETSPPVAWDRTRGPDHAVTVNGEIVRRVLCDGVAVLDSDAPDPAPRGRNADNHRPGSVLCVPLLLGERILGGIYLDSANPATPFTRDDLQLVAAIAALAAIGIENARQFERLGLENQQLRAEVSLQHDMVGQSPRMRQVYQLIEKVAPSDSTVLICGESGTGKELAARAIHNNSQRKEKPFVALNCAALTETLLESELFGHEKGAFTSAICQKKGLLEVAEGGTVFLDEVGELPLTLQAKMLRVLQERECVRVGGTRPTKLNIRLLAATNRDLQKASREGTFRADLFHRLNVITLQLPPLREHPEDIALLAEYFAARCAVKCSRKISGISSEARVCLTQYEWPGNIRELENAIERAVVLGVSETIQAEDLPEALLEAGVEEADGAGAHTSYHDAVREFKKQIIQDAVKQSRGSLTEAAKLMGVHPNYLHRLIRNLDLRLALKKQISA